MAEKREHVMPSYRVAKEHAKEYYQASAYFGLTRTGTARAMMLAVIEHVKAKDKLLFPLKFRVYGDGFESEVRR